jgi:phosphatidylethanolamine-binding protein (PEBP) family uncharacterized protein
MHPTKKNIYKGFNNKKDGNKKNRISQKQFSKNYKKKLHGGTIIGNENKNYLIIKYPGMTSEIKNSEEYSNDIKYMNTQPNISINKQYGNGNGNGNDNTYLLIMYDPDAPNGFNEIDKKTNNNWFHWICIITQTNQNSNIRDILPYMGPNPPHGKHRYYFTLYPYKKIKNSSGIQILNELEKNKYSNQKISRNNIIYSKLLNSLSGYVNNKYTKYFIVSSLE